MDYLKTDALGIVCPFCRTAVPFNLVSYHYHESRRPNGEACQYDARRSSVKGFVLPYLTEDPWWHERRKRLTLARDSDGDYWFVVELEGEGDDGKGNGYFEGVWPMQTTANEVIELMLGEEKRLERELAKAQARLDQAVAWTSAARAYFAEE